MAHQSHKGAAATVAQAKGARVHPAVMGVLALLVTSLLLLLIGPTLVARLESSAPGSSGLATKVIATGLALGGAAAMIAVLAQLVRDIERHAFACLSAVLATFSGCVMWSLEVKLPSVQLPLSHVGLFGLGVTVAAGGAIAHGSRGLRGIGWLLALFAPASLMALLWAGADRGDAVTALATSDPRSRLLLVMSFGTSLVIALLGEAVRGMSPRRSVTPRHVRDRSPQAAHAVQAAPASPARAIAVPAPSLPPDTHRVRHPSAADARDFRAAMRPSRRPLYIAAAALSVLAAGLGTWIALRIPRGSAPAPQAFDVAIEASRTGAAPVTITEPPLAPAPEVAAPPSVQARVEAWSGAGPSGAAQPIDPATVAAAAATPQTEASEAATPEMATVEAETEPEARAAGSSESRAHAARARREETRKRARARRARAARKAAARQAAARRVETRAQAEEPAVAAAEPPTAQPSPEPARAPKADPAEAEVARAEPKPAPSARAPADDSIEALMEHAVQNEHARSRSDDPIFGL